MHRLHFYQLSKRALLESRSIENKPYTAPSLPRYAKIVPKSYFNNQHHLSVEILRERCTRTLEPGRLIKRAARVRVRRVEKRSIKSLVYGRPHSSATPFLQHILQPRPHTPALADSLPHVPFVTPRSLPASRARFASSLLSTTGVASRRARARAYSPGYGTPPLDGDGGRKRERDRASACNRTRTSRPYERGSL